MARAAWLTDIHLNFLWEAELNAFFDLIRASGADTLLFGGDIAEAVDIEPLMARVAQTLGLPIYFVLGNHDYYRGSIAAVRASMKTITERHPLLRWLPVHGIVSLASDTVLIGHGGWGDARCGDYANSTVLLNDYRLIDELSGIDSITRMERLNALGDEAAAFLRPLLVEALARAPRVVLLTHVPPYRESCWHEGSISDDNWLPHFTCKAVGEMLTEVMRAHPQQSLTVLCGHTHSAGVHEPLPNLVVKTGRAEYGTPEIQEVLALD